MFHRLTLYLDSHQDDINEAIKSGSWVNTCFGWVFMMVSRLAGPVMTVSIAYIILYVVEIHHGFDSVKNPGALDYAYGLSNSIVNVAPELVFPGVCVLAIRGLVQRRWLDGLLYLSMAVCFAGLTMSLVNTLTHGGVTPGYLANMLTWRAGAAIAYTVVAELCASHNVPSPGQLNRAVDSLRGEMTDLVNVHSERVLGEVTRAIGLLRDEVTRLVNEQGEKVLGEVNQIAGNREEVKGEVLGLMAEQQKKIMGDVVHLLEANGVKLLGEVNTLMGAIDKKLAGLGEQVTTLDSEVVELTGKVNIPGSEEVEEVKGEEAVNGGVVKPLIYLVKSGKSEGEEVEETPLGESGTSEEVKVKKGKNASAFLRKLLTDDPRLDNAAIIAQGRAEDYTFTLQLISKIRREIEKRPQEKRTDSLPVIIVDDEPIGLVPKPATVPIA